MLNRDQLIELLEKKYSKLKPRTTEEFDGSPDGIWIAGDDSSITAKDGKRLFDYHTQDRTELKYIMGVHKEFNQVLANAGWYGEWYDAGTLMVWVH